MKRLRIRTMLLTGVACIASAREPAAYLNETYQEHGIGEEPALPVLRRDEQVTVADGAGRVGEGKVAHYKDNTDRGGALEYNLGIRIRRKVRGTRRTGSKNTRWPFRPSTRLTLPCRRCLCSMPKTTSSSTTAPQWHCAMR